MSVIIRILIEQANGFISLKDNMSIGFIPLCLTEYTTSLFLFTAYILNSPGSPKFFHILNFNYPGTYLTTGSARIIRYLNYPIGWIT